MKTHRSDGVRRASPELNRKRRRIVLKAFSESQRSKVDRYGAVGTGNSLLAGVQGCYTFGRIT
ncbi:MAG: hypothetical protein A4E19_14670 [Nitrospira sp. SG-bin1]|nr:MAG: hypothetical protein A4E19_14670 [Nitrospira sp. SG-bin1]